MSLLSQVGGFFKGAGEVVGETVEGAANLVAGTAETAYDTFGGVIVDPAVRAAEGITGQPIDRPDWLPDTERGIQRIEGAAKVAGTIVTHPGAVVRAITDPIAQDWSQGNYGEAVGRGFTEAASLLVGTHGADKLAKLGRIGEVAEATSTASRVAEAGTDAGRVAEVSTDAGRVAGTADHVRTLSRPARAAEDAAGAEAAAAAGERRLIEFDPGNKGAWNPELNKPLEADARYVDRQTGYAYTTDGQGRVAEVDGKLVDQPGERNGYQQAHAGGADRLPTDDGGHLIATIFRGPGERINLVPMDSNLNRGAWKAMENSWSGALASGKQVEVKIDVVYGQNGVRPTRFDVSYQIEGQAPVTRTFKNAPGGL
jgi:hypothetical protein